MTTSIQMYFTILANLYDTKGCLDIGFVSHYVIANQKKRVTQWVAENSVWMSFNCLKF